MQEFRLYQTSKGLVFPSLHPFPVFCVLLMISGVLSYCLTVYQIFLGPKEDKVGTGSGEEAGVEGESTEVWTTGYRNIQQDIIAVVGGQGECSTNNATAWPEMGEKKKITKNADSLSKESIELKGIQAKQNLICPMEVRSDPVKGSGAKRVPWKVKSGSCQEQGSKLSVEMEIPGLAINPKADTKTQGMKPGALDNNKEALAQRRR